MKRTLPLMCTGLALLSSHETTLVAQDNENACGASVTIQDTRHDTANGDWYFVFDVSEGSAPGTVSSGQFYYTVHYVDSNNVPHNAKYQSDSWAAGDGHHFSMTLHKSIPEAATVNTVEISDVSSGGCSP